MRVISGISAPHLNAPGYRIGVLDFWISLSSNVKVYHVVESQSDVTELMPLPCVCRAWARCNRVKVPCFMNPKSIIELDYGNCKIVRFCGKEADGKDVSRFADDGQEETK